MNPPDPHEPFDGQPPTPGQGLPARDWRTWWHSETSRILADPRHAAPDPFAARRAEPRLFAFFWTVYLLVAVLGAVVWLTRAPMSGSTGPSAFSPAARTMLVVIAAGIVILWPMTRLSQLAPARPVVRAVALDLLVMLGPAQLVIWPLVVLADWPVKVVAAVSVQLAGWAALVGGVLAIALVRRSRTGGLTRGSWKPGLSWMLLVILMVVALPLAIRIFIPLGSAGWVRDLAAALSPFDFGGSMLGQGTSGPLARPTAARWAGIGGLWAVATVLWVIAALNEATGNRTERGRFV